jgi:hypothetical protein
VRERRGGFRRRSSKVIMAETRLGAAQLFASHYQIVVCDDPFRVVTDEENWTDASMLQGFAGAPCFRMVLTQAHLNDHWVELCLSDEAPRIDDWQRVTCFHFQSTNGRVHVMSVIDHEPPISAQIAKGDYAAYVAGQNLGIDSPTLAEDVRSAVGELAGRKDAEWYRIYLVPGVPTRDGRLRDAFSPSQPPSLVTDPRIAGLVGSLEVGSVMVWDWRAPTIRRGSCMWSTA